MEFTLNHFFLIIKIKAYDLFNNSELITDITSLIYEFSLQSQFKDLLMPENGNY